RVYPARGFSPHAARIPAPPAASTLGQQRATNPVLRLPLRSFAAIAVPAAHAAPAPAYAEHALTMNLEERPSLETILEDVAPLDLESVLNAVARGALLVDARPA